MQSLNRHYYISKKIAFASFFFLFFPLYVVPWIVKGMIHQEKWAFILWAIFMGLLGVLFPPVGDFYRYTEDYYLYKYCDWNTFLELLTFKFDFLLSFLSYLIAKLELNFDLVRFLFNTISYYLIGCIYLDICKGNKYLSENQKIGLYALFLFIPFNLTIYLYRFFFSMVLFIYGGYIIVYRKKNVGWLYALFSVFNHFAFIVFFVALILQRLRLFRLKRCVVVLIILMALFLNNILVTHLFSILPVDIVNRYSAYIDGNWAGEFLEDRSIKYKIMFFLNSVIIYVGCIVYILCYSKGKVEQLSFTNVLLVLSFLTLPFAIMHGRFLIVLLFAIKIYFLIVYDGSRTMKYCLKCMFWCVMISNIMGIWGVRRQIAISEYSQLLYSSSFHILTFSYDENWIDRNIAPNGDIIQLNY